MPGPEAAGSCEIVTDSLESLHTFLKKLQAVKQRKPEKELLQVGVGRGRDWD